MTDEPTGRDRDATDTPSPDTGTVHPIEPLDPLRPIEPIEPIRWCIRLGGVSGRYDGEMTLPNAGKYALDLRVDIDSRHANSPVMNKLSGDIYEVYQWSWSGRTYKWRVYRQSWIVDNPKVQWSRCSVTITGNVRYWTGIHIITTITVTIPWGFQKIGPAEVTFTTPFGSATKYSCAKISNAFRNIDLEVDICQSVNTAPTLPSYNTCAHPHRPAGLPCRTLTIEEAYDEAGVQVTMNPAHTIIDDSAPQFSTWSVAELHDAMETHFSQYPGTWPKWHMWCLLAGTFVNSGVGGIMFDAAASYGGAGEAPDRQGCAVFRNHSWFNSLVANPTTDAQQAAMRKLLYVYVHEMGHAFNYLHSWDKGRPDALSWMNYDWKYDARNGANSFWNNFWLRFDDEELIHLRHGDRASVIMGGDPWASGGHMEVPPSAMVDQVGEAPVELVVRSKGYFQFLEPVFVELRLRNASAMPLDLDTQLHPEFGNVVVYIRTPAGRVVEYTPVLCKLATPEVKTLKPLDQGVQGEDRYSQNILLSYGTFGHYFDMPGQYQVRAMYQGPGDLLVVSPVHHLRVGNPLSRAEEKVAQDYYSYETGMALYMNGSDSPFLEKGMETLQGMADQFKTSPVGAHISLALAQNLARPFHRVDYEQKALVETRAADPQQALDLTDLALKQQSRHTDTFSNLGYHDLRRTRADLLVAVDDTEAARKELTSLARTLKRKGVNQPVLDEIKAYAESL